MVKELWVSGSLDLNHLTRCDRACP